MSVKQVLMGAALSACVTGAAAGADYYVAKCGHDSWSGTSPNCIWPAGPKLTIQAAINVATNGDRIYVAAGTYNEAIDFGARSLELISLNGAQATILDGTSLDRSILTMTGVAPPVVVTTLVQGFRFINGEGTELEIHEGVLQRFGGAVFCDHEVTATIRACTFDDNAAPGGLGGAIVYRDAFGVIEHCGFGSNTAGEGGAIANLRSSPTIRACGMFYNTAEVGGAIANTSSSPTLVQCLILYNEAIGDGGAIHNFAGNPTLVNCTIAENESVVGYGGGLFNNSAFPTLINCIVWGNADWEGVDSSAQIHVAGSAPTVRYSCVQGGWSGLGDHNTAGDPLFTGGYDLGAFSSAVDAGDSGAVPAGLVEDLHGVPRFRDDHGVPDLGAGVAPLVDMGAFERQLDSTMSPVRVPLDFATIQNGINACTPDGEVIVSPGTYHEAIDLEDKSLHLRKSDEPGQVIIDGAGLGDVVTVAAGAAPILEGLIIRGGGPPTGSGIYIDNASAPIIRRCIIVDCDGGFGGGLRILGESEPEIIDCTIRSNTAGFGGGLFADGDSLVDINETCFVTNTASIGGGVYCGRGSVLGVAGSYFTGNTAMGSGHGGAMFIIGSPNTSLTHNRFIDNHAVDGGALLIADGSNLEVFRCMFAGNVAENNGGAIAIDTDSFPVVGNSAFCGNRARFGGAVHTYHDGPILVHEAATISNCTFADNIAELGGGALYMFGIEMSLTNSILWQNVPDQIEAMFHPGVVAQFCDIQGGWPGLSNMDASPLLVDPDGADGIIGTMDDNLRVAPGSPVIDQGSNAHLPPGAPLIDLDGNDRIANGTVDMGAFEYTAGTAGCPEDLNGNGLVDFPDLLRAIAAWGPCPGCPEDLDGNDTVAFSDLLMIISRWGPCP